MVFEVLHHCLVHVFQFVDFSWAVTVRPSLQFYLLLECYVLLLNVVVIAGTWSISQTRHLHVSTSTGKEERRKSGDEILTQSAPSVQSPRKTTPTIFDAFRPRSKSDASKAKKPATLITQMKNAVQVCYSYCIVTMSLSTQGLNSEVFFSKKQVCVLL